MDSSSTDETGGDNVVLSELIQEYNASFGLEQVKQRIQMEILNTMEESFIKSILKKHGYDVDLTCTEIMELFQTNNLPNSNKNTNNASAKTAAS
jgi:hypothetical protein